MERAGRVQLWAGAAMLVLCLLIGGVEGWAVLEVGSWTALVPWLAVYLGALTGMAFAALRSPPPTPRGRVLLVVGAVLPTSALVLLSPSEGGLVYILLVLGAALAAEHLGTRGIVAVVLWNAGVVVASGAGLGPLRDGPVSPRWLLVSVVLYTLLQAASAAMAWSLQRVATALQDLSVAHVELRSTSALLAESSQAEERLRISRELHDVLGHQLTVLSVELEVASHRAEGPAREHVLRARGLARELLADVRSVVGTERQRSFDLSGALARVTEEIPHPRVHLDVAPGLAPDDRHAATLVRAVQEIATNTIRHARAENLWISLVEADGVLCLDARDDGVGAPQPVLGNGLNGLTERTAALGGTVELDGAAGFRVRVRLPLAAGVPA